MSAIFLSAWILKQIDDWLAYAPPAIQAAATFISACTAPPSSFSQLWWDLVDMCTCVSWWAGEDCNYPLVFYWTRQQCGCAQRSPTLDPLFPSLPRSAFLFPSWPRSACLFPSLPRSAFNFKTVGLMHSVYGTLFIHSEFSYFLLNIVFIRMYIQ
jgi:hypothetical protein